MDKTLRIQESGTMGVYKFTINDIDVTEHINRAEMYLYYRRPDDEKHCRVLIGADFQLPARYQMTIYREKTNGCNR